MKGVIEKQQELEKLCTEQAAKIEQLTRLVTQFSVFNVYNFDQYIWLSSLVTILYVLQVEQHKLQTENETEELVGASNGERLPSANENQVGCCFDILCELSIVNKSERLQHKSRFHDSAASQL